MAKNNKSYRIRTNVGREADTFLDVHLDQEYDSLEILSLKISDKDVYKLHNSDYGVVVGRVIANGNFGVPNAKISVFIEADEQNSSMEMWNLYPYTSTSTKNDKDIRYNLLPDESVKDCHKAVGTFPHKTFLLENDALLEVFDKYYVYTTRTNASGDYLLCGVPTGMQTIHMDLDLSDCGILSQRPRDFVYKGYTIEQFENPNQFKKDENIDGLSQIFSQNQPVYVNPFWGNSDNGENIGITRADIEISFKFEPTCVFMGSAISDNASNGVGKKCVPTNQMGVMDELTAGEGTIEMIRKTPGGNVEEFSIKGNQVIDGNGVWCYQIPMNLDYMMTDEYGNMVPTDDPEKGIPTRTRVRFRASLTDMDGSSQSYYRAKYLIPNNPGIDDNKVDYNFGTYTDEDSYRDLFWNGVYTVKSYIPRFQKSKRWRSERFSGIKACNYYGGNNPVPYNNMRIKLPFMFTVLCIFVKLFIKIVTLVNRIEAGILRVIVGVLEFAVGIPLKGLATGLMATGLLFGVGKKLWDVADDIVSNLVNKLVKDYTMHCTFIGDGLCPDMEGWYFAPGCGAGIKKRNKAIADLLMENTLAAATENGDEPDADDDAKDAMKSTEYTDETSIDNQNITSNEEETACLTTNVDYLLNCFEMNLAQEYRVIKFDFYNDWVNGVLYFPRWMRKIKRKKKYKFSLKNGITSYYKDKVKGCMNSENSRVKKSRYYTQQCSLSYREKVNEPWTSITTYKSCYKTAKAPRNKNGNSAIFPSKCHKRQGMVQSSIFGKKSGLVTEQTTMLGQFVYYLKPCEWKDTDNGRKRTLLFATDIVLLGTLNDCDENGIPQAFRYLNNSSYIMPTNLALTTMDDDSYIYSKDDSTVCSSSKQPLEQTDSGNTGAGGVRRITPDYQSTYSAYSKTDGDEIEYGENDDPIPITEAAGITWNYSGPGQDDVPSGKLETPSDLINRLWGNENGNKKYETLYYPGGHFLGLSCVNSDTNIKSCVNLKRICEVGATMSQRREELRGYTADGKPKYRYYVPTGLISNVDIEGASFRSMFASMNHNKLVATERNETTGYKKYNFRFLRPDGFDGSLGNYVHMSGSPYNKSVNKDLPEEDKPVKDATTFFKTLFPLSWFEPEDYDPDETDFTERRTIEDTINDYYMFRFGLDSFATKEQKKRFLVKSVRNTNDGYSLPQYENSFYFYFGLKDGSTALDEFKKQFFSECESNNIMKTPVIHVNEIIGDDLVGKATLTIDNMLSPYSVTIKDDTMGSDELGPFNIEDDTFSLDEISGLTITIGHQYTVTVTDSIDQTATETFVFGADAVSIEAETIHFRVSGYTETKDPKKGGFVKINDTVTILGKTYNISSEAVSFEVHKVTDSGEEEVTPTSGSYVDASNEMWNLYYLPETGTYNFYIQYSGSTESGVSVYTTTIYDNTDVNLFVGCNYLSYKPEIDPVTRQELPSRNLREITRDDQWLNGEPFTGNSKNSWLMRHTYYRQTQNNNLPYDNYIYTNSNYNIAIFGQPEKGNLTSSGEVHSGGTFYRDDYQQYAGYFIDDNYSFIPTMYWNPESGDEYYSQFRNTFDAMSYTDDGRAAADALSASATSYTYTDGKIILGFNDNSNKLVNGHGAIVVFEDGTKIFPVVKGNYLEAYYDYDIYQGLDNAERLGELLQMATIYPTMQVPTIYKPFYAAVSAVTWNVQQLTMGTDDDGNPMPEKQNLPASYKVEGDIYNGLTFNNGHFYSGDTVENYDTYLVFRDDANFYNTLTAETRNDYEPHRKLSFGHNVFSPGFGREISEINENIKDIVEFSYGIKEGFPIYTDAGEESLKKQVFTGRYLGGFDLEEIGDACDIYEVFADDLKLKAYQSTSGINGICSIYSENINETNTKYYLIPKPIDFFNESGILELRDGLRTYAHGYYNQNSKNDVKGSTAKVEIINGTTYRYSTLQDNGAVVRKTANGIPALERNGITLSCRYTLKGSYKNNISGITDAINTSKFPNNDDGLVMSSKLKTSNYTQFIGSDYSCVVGIYENQEPGSMNKMVVYKLYPLLAMDIIFPAENNGVDPYLSTPTGGTYSKEEQIVTISVSTNVKFVVEMSSTNWASIIGGPTFSSTATSVSVSISANTGSATSNRNVLITFRSVEDGVPSITTTFSLTQIKDEITPVEEKAEQAQATATSAAEAAAEAESSASSAQGTASAAYRMAQEALDCCNSSDDVPDGGDDIIDGPDGGE